MAIKIGITGGIGSGKSVVSELFEVMGVPVYVSDIEAKRLTVTHKEIRSALSVLVGEEVYRGTELNRSLLASYMFGHPERVKRVNEIIHPHVKEDFRRWVSEREGEVFVGMESAILIESGFKKEVDFLVLVYAPLSVRIDRVMQRDDLSHEAVLKRMQAQMSDEEKKRQADFVIFNEAERPLIPQVLRLFSLLSENNEYLCSTKK